jgi:hypothetical protein
MGPLEEGDPGMGGEPDGGGLYRGLLGDFFGLVGPYADGGCCAPRYFDLSLEAMWLQRDGERNILLSSNGIAGNSALSTNQFRYGERPSFRFTGWLPFRSLGNLEFTYYGLFHHAAQVQANSPGDNLFSALSNFGTQPFGGFKEDGNARYQREEISSTFDNFEMNYRRHWQGADCRLQGSWVLGCRYFKFDEDFDFVSVSPLNAGQLRYHINATNSLVGAQTGGDSWICLIPGVRLGGEFKAGVYGNHSSQGSRFTATSLAVPYTESAGSNDVAFVSDAALFVTWRINYQLNLKIGYNFLFVDGLTLASENFNKTPPSTFVNGSGRVATLNDNGNVFYNGYSLGFEYNW